MSNKQMLRTPEGAANLKRWREQGSARALGQGLLTEQLVQPKKV